MMIANSGSEPTHVLFGGTFDPPHEGHRLIIRQALKALPQATLIVTPSFEPAGAYGDHKTVATSFADRVAMCELAFADEIASGRVVLDTLEKDLPVPNYTYRTLEALEQAYPGSRWGLLFGFDQLGGFPGWMKAAELVARYSLIAMQRPGFAEWKAIRPKLEDDFGAIQPLDGVTYRLASGQTLRLIAGEVSEAQSRLIRGSLETSEAKGWLSPKVIQYIREHGLYGEG